MIPDRVSAYYRTRGRAVPQVRREPRECRCVDCGRTWPERESEIAYAHVTSPDGCPERKR